MRKKTESGLKKALRGKDFIGWRVFLDHTLPKAALEASKSDFPMASLLIQTNLLEFHIVQLICVLSLAVHLSSTTVTVVNKERRISIKPITPKEIFDEGLTLGRLIKKIDEFSFKGKKELITELTLFNRRRVKFTHKLCEIKNMTDINSLNKEAEMSYKWAWTLTKHVMALTDIYI